MIVAITGTPGTGKTTLVQNLQAMGYKTIDLSQVIDENNFVTGFDSNRDTQEVDLGKLNEYLKEHLENIDKTEIVLIDSHLSHNLSFTDIIIILRCHPKTLETRLKNKGYNPTKIQENLEAEAIDVITIESVELHGNNEVYEIDVTNKNVNDVANDVLKIIKCEDSARDDYKIGKIDWSEEILEWY